MSIVHGIRTVDPVLLVESTGDDARSETASWVKGAASVIYTDELGNEEGETDADGGNEGSF